MTLDTPLLWQLAPRAREEYRRAFDLASEVLPRFEITTARRLVHFLAQVLHETNGLTVLKENLHYRAERLMEVWPARFPTLAIARVYAENPERLANRVYGGRLGNTEPGDGWKFIGRGLLQLTGRANYLSVGLVLGIDLVGDPELAIHPDHALAVGACIWHLHGCNAAADEDDVRLVTQKINGGTIGIDDRERWLQQTRKAVLVA